MLGYNTDLSTTQQILHHISTLRSNRSNAVDVYETDDTIQQNDISNNSTNERTVINHNINPDIITTRTAPTLIFEKFADQIYFNPMQYNAHAGGRTVDRNQQLSASDKLLSSYSSNTSEIPQQRLQRLRDEITDFSYELQLLKQNPHHGAVHSTDIDNIVEQLESELNALQKQLSTLQCDTNVQNALNTDQLLLILHGTISHQQLNDHINHSTDTHTHTLQSTTNLSHNDIDKRFLHIQQRIGTAALSVKQSGNDVTQFNNVNTAIQYITDKIGVLDPIKLNQIKQQCKIATVDMQLLEQQYKSMTKQSTTLTTQQLNQIDTTYNLLCQYEYVCAAVPQLIQQLQQLRTLHSTSSHAMHKLHSIDTLITAMDQQRQTDIQAVNALNHSLAQTIESMRTNFQSLDERITKLQL